MRKLEFYDIIVLHPRAVAIGQDTVLNAVITYAGYEKIRLNPERFGRNCNLLRTLTSQKLLPAIDRTEMILTGYISHGRTYFEVMTDAATFAIQAGACLQMHACTLPYTPVRSRLPLAA